jgi:hypothetical protein
MDALDRAQSRADDLRALLRDFRSVAGGVPGLDRPAAAVGRPGSWTGAAADRLHRDELAPLASRLPRSLSRAEQAIRDELTRAERTLRGAQDDAREAARRDAR